MQIKISTTNNKK